MPSKRILDPACGSRMMWFDRSNPDTVYMDNRCETHSLQDKSSKGGSRKLVISPDVLGDFRNMPFADQSFSLVVFDPPHLVSAGRNGWLSKKYGCLSADWRDDIKAGFLECFRVLKDDGVLVFKWNEMEITTSEVVGLAPFKPLFGNRCGRTAKSHWLVFMKPVLGESAA